MQFMAIDLWVLVQLLNRHWCHVVSDWRVVRS